MGEYSKPVPRPEDPALTRPFWEAAKRHELIIPRCRLCDRYFFYPRQACPYCLREQWEWAPASGRARLHSFTVVHQPQHPAFQADVPYAYAIVQLEEGVRMISNVVGCDVEKELRIDMPLVVDFDDVTAEWTLPKFRPA
jgi:uncharacterized OB-fold protein